MNFEIARISLHFFPSAFPFSLASTLHALRAHNSNVAKSKDFYLESNCNWLRSFITVDFIKMTFKISVLTREKLDPNSWNQRQADYFSTRNSFQTLVGKLVGEYWKVFLAKVSTVNGAKIKRQKTWKQQKRAWLVSLVFDFLFEKWKVERKVNQSHTNKEFSGLRNDINFCPCIF